MSIQATPTEAQLADILTKPLPEPPHMRHRKAIMAWYDAESVNGRECSNTRQKGAKF